MASDMKEKELVEKELLEIAEYEKVIRFRDRIFAGTHPRIKVPLEVLMKAQDQFVRSFLKPQTFAVAQHQPISRRFIATSPSAFTVNSPPAIEYSVLPPGFLAPQLPAALPLRPASAQSTKPFVSNFSSSPYVVDSAPSYPQTLPAVHSVNEPSTYANDTRSATDPQLNPEINYKLNYYQDLRVQRHVTQSSISRVFTANCIVSSPYYPAGKEKFDSENEMIRLRAMLDWQEIEKAYKILSNPFIRRHYDERYVGKAEQPLSCARSSTQRKRAGAMSVEENRARCQAKNVPRQERRWE
ncbi:hypothetical protein B0J14DRAFT_672381 [Halenospora varia]|nr:hypothetical protein B0J14DRAFT_672381 [Halenospora varia]